MHLADINPKPKRKGPSSFQIEPYKLNISVSVADQPLPGDPAVYLYCSKIDPC